MYKGLSCLAAPVGQAMCCIDGAGDVYCIDGAHIALVLYPIHLCVIIWPDGMARLGLTHCTISGLVWLTCEQYV